MWILKTRLFDRWAKKEKLNSVALKQAALEVNEGLVDSSLGGGLFKKRVPLAGRGKSGGARTLLAYSSDKRIVFLDGFAKNEKANISSSEKKVLH